GLRAFVAILSLVRDLRAFVERLVPAALNRAEVHEEVLPTLVGRDEAVPLLRVEPLDGSGCHFFLHLLANFVNGQEGALAPSRLAQVLARECSFRMVEARVKPGVKPRLRGVFHEAGFFLVVALSVPLALSAEGGRALS